MKFGNIQGLVNGTESVVYDYTVSGSARTTIDTSTDGNIATLGDGEYTIILFGVAGSSGDNIRIRFNGVANDTYFGSRSIYAYDTSVGDDTGITIGATTANTSPICLGVFNLIAKTNYVKLMNGLHTRNIGGTTVTILISGGYVNNSTDALSSIQFLSASANQLGVGTRVIILKKNNFTEGTLTGVINSPYIQGSWVRVGTPSIGSTIGSIILPSATNTLNFTNLDGNTAVCFYLRSQIKASGGGTGHCLIRFNGDTGNNYGRQENLINNTTISGNRAVASAFNIAYAGTNGYYGQGEMLIFAKSGFIRPSLCASALDITGTTVGYIVQYGNSWNNSSDNITQISLTTSSNNWDAGSQFDLYALYK